MGTAVYGERAGERGGESSHLPSLLWPAGSGPQEPLLSPETWADLDLTPVLQALSGGDVGRERYVRRVLGELCTDRAVIAHRADTVDNLLSDAALQGRLTDLLPEITTLVEERKRPLFSYQWSVADVVQRLGELQLYVDVALGLRDALEGHPLKAPGLLALRDAAIALTDSDGFRALRSELPDLLARLQSVRSITIGVNLSSSLQPESATILSVDTERIEGRGGLLERLLGEGAATRGVTSLRGTSGSPLRAFFPSMGVSAAGRQNELVEDLQRLLERVVSPIGEAIERYVWAQTRDFAALESELSFLLNGVALAQRLRERGLPICRARIADPDERISCMDGSYNVSLALRTGGEGGGSRIVTNPVVFDDEQGRIWILTGPNRGGKTTYVRAVGLSHILAQAGLPVPAQAARLSPVDAVFTHFPTAESATPGEGRLDEEAVRLAAIFGEATPRSLILLNEVLSGTSTVEALALARDAVRGLCLLGARAIYVTHLHELAAGTDEINGMSPGCARAGSLTAEVEGEVGVHRRTFRIRPGPPSGVSYASDIAEQHGISYPQLVELLHRRGLLAAEET